MTSGSSISGSYLSILAPDQGGEGPHITCVIFVLILGAKAHENEDRSKDMVQEESHMMLVRKSSSPVYIHTHLYGGIHEQHGESHWLIALSRDFKM